MASALHRDIPHYATAARLSLHCHVVGARRDASDPQLLVVLDGSIAIVPTLVRTPPVLACRRHPQAGERMQCKIPESDAFAVLRRRTATISKAHRD
jgi:hypothetical protein